MTYLVCTPEEFLTASFADRRKLVLAQIDATPSLWDQTRWMNRTECGTSYCFAGWACALADQMPGEILIGTKARKLLGLDPGEFPDPFDAANTRDDLGRIVEELNREEP